MRCRPLGASFGYPGSKLVGLAGDASVSHAFVRPGKARAALVRHLETDACITDLRFGTTEPLAHRGRLDDECRGDAFGAKPEHRWISGVRAAASIDGCAHTKSSCRRSSGKTEPASAGR